MNRERLIVVWLVAVLALGLVLITGHGLPRFTAEAGRGKPRDVPMELLRRRIQQRKLSDREALFYKKLGQGQRDAKDSRPRRPPNRR